MTKIGRRKRRCGEDNGVGDGDAGRGRNGGGRGVYESGWDIGKGEASRKEEVGDVYDGTTEASSD